MYRPAHPHSPARARGLSLIETMAAVTILGFLVAMTAPSFARIGERYKSDSVQAELVSTIQTARAQAIQQGQQVTIRRNTGCPQATHPEDWRCGWTTFIDRNRNRLPDADDVLIGSHGPVQGQEIRLEGPDGQSLSYTPLGRTDTATQSLLLIPDGREPGNPVRRLCLTLGGSRVKMIDGASACS